MVLVRKDRIRQATTTTGTGTLTLGAAITGYQAFSAIGTTNSTAFCIEAVDANGIPSGEWEVSVGVYTTAGTTLSRALVLASSTGSAVAFAAGTKHVFCVPPAAEFVNWPTPGVCTGRLTVLSGSPIPSADTTSTNIYLTPMGGTYATVYNGTMWLPYSFSEITLALGTLVSASNYDVFVYDVAGALTLKLGPAWTSDTGRGAGAGTTELTTQDGAYVNNVAITSGPAAKAGLYLGTIRTVSTTQVTDSVLTRFVWNRFNKVPRNMKVTDTTNTWTYGTAAMRSWNNSTANRVQVLVGLQESYVSLEFVDVTLAGADAGNPQVGIGFDSVTVDSSDVKTFGGGSSSITLNSHARIRHLPAIGFHYYQCLEYYDTGGGSGTFYGDGNRTYTLCGMVGEILS